MFVRIQNDLIPKDNISFIEYCKNTMTCFGQIRIFHLIEVKLKTEESKRFSFNTKEEALEEINRLSLIDSNWSV